MSKEDKKPAMAKKDKPVTPQPVEVGAKQTIIKKKSGFRKK